jgi:uncharacterized membrane protein YphA (DoxX/SURF4 family)
MSIIDFLFHYQVHSTFVGCYRIVTIGFLLGWFLTYIKTFFTWSTPTGPYPHRWYMEETTSLSFFKYLPPKLYSTYIVFIGTILFGFLTILGLLTNVSLLLFILFFTSIQNRISPIHSCHGDYIVKGILLCLLITDCGAGYSLDNYLGIRAWFSNYFNVDFDHREYVDGLGIRLIQINVVMIYFWSAVYKLRDKDWVKGTVITDSLNSRLWGNNYLLQFKVYRDIINNKLFSKTACWSTIMFEYFAPFLFFFKETRIFALLAGLSLHIGIIIFMYLGYFGHIMILALLSFCNFLFK